MIWGNGSPPLLPSCAAVCYRCTMSCSIPHCRGIGDQELYPPVGEGVYPFTFCEQHAAQLEREHREYWRRRAAEPADMQVTLPPARPVLTFVGATIAAAGFPLATGDPAGIIFFDEHLVITAAGAEQPSQIAREPYAAVDFVRVGGRGAVESGGGWFGGGFGLTGALTGAVIGSALNSMTRTTSLECFLDIGFGEREVLLLSRTDEPSVLRVSLAPVIAKVGGTGRGTSDANETTIEQLQKLAVLRSQDALTEAEFQAAKSAALKQMASE